MSGELMPGRTARSGSKWQVSRHYKVFEARKGEEVMQLYRCNVNVTCIDNYFWEEFKTM
jgi:hypothetical protein